jgi:hypothetical protein
MGDETPPLLLPLNASTDGFLQQLGGATYLDDDQRTKLDAYVVVVYRGGMCSLHRVTNILRRNGRRAVQFGPQVEWPSGGTELRDINLYRKTADA